MKCLCQIRKGNLEIQEMKWKTWKFSSVIPLLGMQQVFTALPTSSFKFWMVRLSSKPPGCTTVKQRLVNTFGDASRITHPPSHGERWNFQRMVSLTPNFTLAFTYSCARQDALSRKMIFPKFTTHSRLIPKDLQMVEDSIPLFKPTNDG